jgi:hypothetical protein
VPKSNTWRGADFRTLKPDELIDAICELDQLEVFNLRGAVWMTRKLAEEIVRRAGGEIGLRQVNFSGCGMNPGRSSWSRKWMARRTDSVRSLLIFD